jgi:hypothetical protein
MPLARNRRETTTLIANIDLEPTLDAKKIVDFVGSAVKQNEALRHKISDNTPAVAPRLKELASTPFELSKCPELVNDHGDLFGSGLPDAGRRALVAGLKRL